MEVSVKIIPNKKTQAGLRKIPDRIVYQAARITLDMARSTNAIPMSPPGTKTRGRLRTSSMSGGVRGGNGNYYIGSYTSYASYVWKMPDSTNWTIPGSNNRWYERTLKRHGKVILDRATNQGWRETM